MNNTMMSFFLLLVLALSADSNDTSVSVSKFNIDPYCCIDIESHMMFLASTANNDSTSELCSECDGKGYLGDGRVKVDCPSCDLDPLGTIQDTVAAVICNCEDCTCEDCQCTADECKCVDCKKKESLLQPSTDMPYVVYYIGATWCAPCRQFKLQLHSEGLKNKGYKVVKYGEPTAGVHVIELDYDKDRDFIKEKFGNVPSTVPQCFGYDNNQNKVIDRFTPAGMSWQSFTQRYMKTYKGQGY